MRILLRATNWVGDVVMSLPALRALRAAFPGAHLAVLARPWVADLYRARPEPDDVLVEDPRLHGRASGRAALAADLDARAFDRAILLPDSFGTAWVARKARIPERFGYRREGRAPLLTTSLPAWREAGVHQVFKHLRLAEAAGAVTPGAPDVSWEVPASLRESAAARLREAGWDGEPFLAAHAASFAHAAKRWPLARFAEVFDLLHATRGLAVVLMGSAGEAGVNAETASLVTRARVLDLSGRSSLPEALGVMAIATAFLGNDSGLAHLAGAAGTPAAVVFGPTDPEATRPWDGPRGDGKPVRLASVRRRVACAPCRNPVCPLDHACQRGVDAPAVAAALERLLG